MNLSEIIKRSDTTLSEMKESLRTSIEESVAEYLASGKDIETVDFGVSRSSLNDLNYHSKVQNQRRLDNDNTTV